MPFLVGIEQGAGLVEDQDAAEVLAAEGAADRLGLVLMDLAAVRALLLAVGQDRAVLLQHVAVLRAQVGKDLVEMGLDLLRLLVGHDAGAVAALGLAVIAFDITGVGPGEDLGIDEDRTDLDKILFCGHC